MAKQLIVLFALVAYASAGMKIGNGGLDLLKFSEGWRADYYIDQIGLKTIGYGHACVWHNNCNDIGKTPLTQQQGVDLLKKDLVEYENCVNNAVSGLNQNQFDAKSATKPSDTLSNSRPAPLMLRPVQMDMFINASAINVMIFAPMCLC
ncbi:unnamed protein product [Medioppia subpectinata]|uniref:Lysozyme n=1 Tax=Medioppia subpectinata TaxID=1979941 RepID=A0A7R9KVJ0_9ACAR|nr:unnamed protein product [Medioppia subpectinata]CAG2109475.1 unnamed protein product [Medioppia subpectinata]